MEIIKKLAKDPDSEVRFALSLQGMFKIEEDEEILGILLDSSPEEKVKFSYRSEPSPKNVIIRYHIARVTKDLEKLETLSQDFDWATRYSVISNQKTSIELIKKMQLLSSSNTAIFPYGMELVIKKFKKSAPLALFFFIKFTTIYFLHFN